MLREGYKDFIDYLNQLHALDSQWITDIICYRPPCNKAIFEHPTVQVGVGDETAFQKDEAASEDFCAGFLGLVNGFFGTYDDGPNKGCGPVAAVLDSDTGKLIRFQVFDEESPRRFHEE